MKNDTQNNYLSKLKITAVVLGLPIFMFLLLGPTEIFYASFSDFDFELKNFIWLFTMVGLLLWIIGSVIIALFPVKINRIINSLIFAASVSAYIQNMFFNVQLMGTVGNLMDWDALKGYTIINTIAWIVMLLVLFIIPLLLKKYTDKIHMYLSAFLIAIQVVAFVSILISLTKDEYKVSYYKLDAKEEYSFATDENVIILLLDATSQRFFSEQVAESPEILDGLEDFTYYTNYEPCYMTTTPAVSYMWTNDTPNCNISLLNWLSDAWHTEETDDFFKRIHDKGYDCRFYTIYQRGLFGDVENLINKVDNITIMDAKINKWLMFSMLEKYTVYRYVPYLLKPRFEVVPIHFRGVATYEEEHDINEYMIDYYEDIQNASIKVDPKLSKLVYYHHFDGIHGPWTIDKDGNRVDEQSESPFVKQVVRGDFVAIKYFLNQLKEKGIYDNSTIIISADHGNVFDHTDLHCIFFLKQKGETHTEIQYNDAPISVDDFRASLLQFIGDDNYKDFGTTYFDWKSGDSRDRYSMIRDLGGLDGFNGYLYNGDGDALYETIMDGYDVNIPNFGGWH